MADTQCSFTPLFDWALRDFGTTGAAVYGAIWRYCQMREGKCWASYATLAEQLGLSRRTVIRHVNTLRASGRILDLTPERNGSVHEYMLPTGDAKSPVTSDIESPVTESHSTSDRKSPPPVTESHSKIRSEDTNEDTNATATARARGRTLIRDPDVAFLFGLIESCGIVIGGQMQSDAWQELLGVTRDHALLSETFAEAAKQPRQPSAGYVRAILERCIAEGRRPGARASPSPARRAESTYERSMAVLRRAMNGDAGNDSENVGDLGSELAGARGHVRDRPALPAGSR